MPDEEVSTKSEAPRGTLNTHLLHVDCQSLLCTCTCIDLLVPDGRRLRPSAKKQKAKGVVCKCLECVCVCTYVCACVCVRECVS